MLHDLQITATAVLDALWVSVSVTATDDAGNARRQVLLTGTVLPHPSDTPSDLVAQVCNEVLARLV